MLSDHSSTPIPFDIPCHPDTLPDNDLLTLNFDDLLDIAREYEFTRTITHLWPCEESSMFSETGLEDILYAITPTPYAEESPLPLSSSTLSMNLNPNLPRIDSHRSTSMCHVPDMNPSLSRDLMLLPTPLVDDQVQDNMAPPITSILRGWSPPNGFQFLDLDNDLILPLPMKDEWSSPWLPTCLEPSNKQPTCNVSQSSMVSGIGDTQSSEAKPTTPTVSKTDQAVDDPARKCLLRGPQLAQPLAPTILEPVGAGSALQANPITCDQTVDTPRTKNTKPGAQAPSVPATSAASIATYARAPRGGIPPHVARTVTKANILRMEKERKVMQDAFSSALTAEGKKPSVLRRAARGERGRETSKNANRGDTRKESCELGGKDGTEGRVAKRARL